MTTRQLIRCTLTDWLPSQGYVQTCKGSEEAN